MKGWLIAAAAALLFSAGVAAQRKDAPDTFELAGVIADAAGPLANKVVRVGPLDDKGNMLRIRSLSGATSGQSLNPQATTDAQGRFALTVARSMFRGYREDQLGLAAYTDLGGGRMSTSHENAIVRIDPKSRKIDTGRLLLQPLKPKGIAR